MFGATFVCKQTNVNHEVIHIQPVLRSIIKINYFISPLSLSLSSPSRSQIYDEKNLLVGKLNLLNNTNMVDFALDVYQKLFSEQAVPDEFLQKRSKIVAELKDLQKSTEPILTILMKEDVAEQIETGPEGKVLFDYCAKNHGVTQENVDSLYKFAKFQYECGNYSGAAQYLDSHRLLVPPTDKFYLSNLWGKLACEILMQQWEHALEDFTRLKEYIDSFPYFTPLESLQQRTWLIHWSLFIFFNHAQGRDMLVDMLFEKKNNKVQQLYLNAIETLAPHILRYVATAVITHRKRRDYMKELVRIIQQESYTYRDAITEFVQCLCVKFDFDAAQQKLKECSDIFESDFFLVALHDEFIESARLFIFEIFCRIHECVSIE